MGELTCCPASSWAPTRELGSAEGFECSLGKCLRCGTPWMNVFCVASGVTGFERVSPEDLQAIQALADGAELKRLVRHWVSQNL